MPPKIDGLNAVGQFALMKNRHQQVLEYTDDLAIIEQALMTLLVERKLVNGAFRSELIAALSIAYRLGKDRRNEH